MGITYGGGGVEYALVEPYNWPHNVIIELGNRHRAYVFNNLTLHLTTIYVNQIRPDNTPIRYIKDAVLYGQVVGQYYLVNLPSNSFNIGFDVLVDNHASEAGTMKIQVFTTDHSSLDFVAHMFYIMWVI